MAGPWVTADNLKQEVADILKKDVSDLAAYWDRHVTRTRNDGYNDLVSRLAGKGYTPAQMDAWDDRERFNRDQALFWLYVKGAGLGAYDDKEINKLDHRKELETATTIMIGGKAVAPGAETVDDGASVGIGTMTEDDYRIKSDTEF